MIGLEEWIQDIRGRRQLTIRAPVSLVGRYDKHLGPSWAYAEIEMIAEPADTWEAKDSLPEGQRAEMEKDGWLREAILGVLDVLVTRPADPVLRLRVHITAARYSFESSRRAFRLAGRRAAEALLDTAEVIP